MRAAQGASNTQIAAEVGVSLPTVGLWRRNFSEDVLPDGGLLGGELVAVCVMRDRAVSRSVEERRRVLP